MTLKEVKTEQQDLFKICRSVLHDNESPLQAAASLPSSTLLAFNLLKHLAQLEQSRTDMIECFTHILSLFLLPAIPPPKERQRQREAEGERGRGGGPPQTPYLLSCTERGEKTADHQIVSSLSPVQSCSTSSGPQPSWFVGAGPEPGPEPGQVKDTQGEGLSPPAPPSHQVSPNSLNYYQTF